MKRSPEPRGTARVTTNRFATMGVSRRSGSTANAAYTVRVRTARSLRPPKVIVTAITSKSDAMASLHLSANESMDARTGLPSAQLPRTTLGPRLLQAPLHEPALPSPHRPSSGRFPGPGLRNYLKTRCVARARAKSAWARRPNEPYPL